MVAPLCVRCRRHKKTRARFRVRGSLGIFRLLLGYLENMPSARTSVGNKEYEYKGKKERAAKQQAIDRRETVRFGGAAGVAALRHDTDRKRCLGSMSTVNFETFSIQMANFIRTSIHPRLERTKLERRQA
jgi:hypothetical protein